MKIALIAMSGVRAYNEALTALGMTMPGFMERGEVIASLPSLSLLTLAGMTPDSLEVEYHQVPDMRKLERLPDCDLAAISTFTAQVKDAYALAARYREAGVKTVIGGHHATALPGEALRHCDAVVVGEAELTWPRVLEDFRNGCLGGIYSAGGQEFDLADSPLPRFDLLNPDEFNRITVQTQRGCPWRCNFCASSIMMTKRYKLKPVENVIREIRAIKEVWSRPFIEFADDNSFVNRSHSKKLLRALAEEGVKWFTESDVAVADDPELLDLMRESGCAEVLIGLESPTAGSLDGVELNNNWKRKRLDGYREAIRRIQSHGIAVNGCFVLGMDGDTVDCFPADAGLRRGQWTVRGPDHGRDTLPRDSAVRAAPWRKAGCWTTPPGRNARCSTSTSNPTGCRLRTWSGDSSNSATQLYTAEAKAGRRNAFRDHVRSARQPRSEEAAACMAIAA